MSLSILERRLSSRTAWLAIGGLLVIAALAFVVFSDFAGGMGRVAADVQFRLSREVTMRLNDLGERASIDALWALVVVGFVYGVAHTLGPGHGKAVVVAYFLDGKKRGWIDGILAGTWVSITHTMAALVLAGVLALIGLLSPLAAQGRVKLVELVSYGLIFAVGLWRLHAGLTGRLHEHDHDHDDHGHDHHHHDHGHHDHDHGHDHHHHHHDHAEVPRWRRFLRLDSGLGLLTAAGVAPCAGAVVMVLVSAAIGVLWAGLLGVVAIAVGMALTLAVIGIGSMLAHRLLVGDRTSNAVGRITTLLAALLVVGTSGFLLFGAVMRLLGD
jgi:ABC-type nickel/cobalt efflux system permease component RcnA